MEAATVGKNDPEQRNSFLQFNFISTRIHFGTIFGKCWTKEIAQCMKVPFASSTWDCIENVCQEAAQCHDEYCLILLLPRASLSIYLPLSLLMLLLLFISTD